MSSQTKVSIGMPVFNAELTIRKSIDSLLSQTFKNFELIISDNKSTDSTRLICEEYAKKDNRISFFPQKRNIGAVLNFLFVLEHAKNEYFMWAASDDWWLPTFLEKNVNELNKNKKLVGSISKIKYFDAKEVKPNKKQSLRIKKFFSYDEYPISGSYEDRIRFYLRLNKAENIYSVFRTDIIKKCYIIKKNPGMDLEILLKVLKFGEIAVIDEKLMYRSTKGISSSTSGVNRFTYDNDYGIIGKIFPFLPFTIWIIRNLGINIFIKNFDYLIFINLSATKYQIKQIFKKL